MKDIVWYEQSASEETPKGPKRSMVFSTSARAHTEDHTC